MKITAVVAFLAVAFASVSCKGQPEASFTKIDTICFDVNEIRPPSDTIEAKSDTADSVFRLIKYAPVRCKAGFTDIKPDKNNRNIKFCVAAAFTSKELTFVVGDYVVQGRFVGQSPDAETGFCVILNGHPHIRKLSNNTDKVMIRAVESKGDFFKQMILVSDFKPVECTIFDKYRPTYRRALVEKDGEFFVAESDDRLSIGEFQTMLMKIKAKNAIYLDMGTWSEGFYRNQDNELISIGKQIQSTKYQTNWLYFEKIE